jgi:hypothetical protein
MKTKKGGKKKSEKLLVHRGVVARQREKMKEQGFFDGRYVARAISSKKKYSRKGKKQKRDYENE